MVLNQTLLRNPGKTATTNRRQNRARTARSNLKGFKSGRAMPIAQKIRFYTSILDREDMMDNMKDRLTHIGETIAGERGKLVVEIGSAIVDAARNKRTLYNQKLECLCRHDIMGWQYTEEMLKIFVKRKFTYYGTEECVNISKVKSEVEFQKLARNVIITGSAGSGKSTALKWLYMNSHIKNSSFLYLYARMFDECVSLQAVLDAVSEAIAHTDQCIIFFDGLDELKCIKGTADEFQVLVDFFSEKSSQEKKEGRCHRFVISTRPEHFSFHKMIRKKNFKKNLDNYIIYELQLLTPKETLKICKSIETLSMYDRKNQFQHFVDKWPAPNKKGHGMTKTQYLRHLKKYLKHTPQEQSLLTLPLLCRYAYPIICELSLQNHINTEQMINRESAQIQYALTSYIKWEFHDTHIYQTAGGEGKELLTNYERRVHGFLSEIAGTMGIERYIAKQKWDKIRRAKKITGNISFCVLQEYDSENMSFIHPLFKEFYLASYCVKVVERNVRKRNFLSEKDVMHISTLLGSSSSVSLMYAEQLLKCNYYLIKNVCTYLLQTIVHDDLRQFAKYASGQARYIYAKEAPFTIEEYLLVFPLGDVQYNDISFNISILNKLYSTGILKVESADSCLGCDLSKISNNLTIKGVKCLGSGFKHTVREFKIFCNGDFINIGGYWQSNVTRQELNEILLHSRFRYLIESMDITVNALLRSDIIRLIMIEKRAKDALRRSDEEKTLVGWMRNFIDLAGKDKNYWCMFDRGSLCVLQMTLENRPQMIELFRQGLSENKIDYVSLYGEYRALTQPIDAIVEEGKNYKTANISVDFDVDIGKLEETDNALRTYYTIHWKNLKLFRKVSNNNRDFFKDDINSMIDVREVLDLYEAAEQFLEKSPNEKLTLYLSDERLFTFYIMGEGDQMVELAQETLELCKKYQHRKGEWFRKLLLSDDMRFTGEDFEKIYAFARDYIWM